MKPKMTKKTKFIFIYAASLMIVLAAASLIIARVSEKKYGGSVSRNLSGDEIETIFLELNEEEEEAGLSREEPKEHVEEALDTSPEAKEQRGSLEEELKSIEGLSLEHGTGYIFIGDSRFVHMNDVCKISDVENLFMVAKVGEGYSWFSKDALKQVKRIVGTGLFPKWKLVICLGINDLGNQSKYLEKYGQLKEEYDISLVSVNPITSYGTLTNPQIEEFNRGLEKAGLPYIDTYRLLMVTGYATTDGLHYNGDTTRKIYDGIRLGLRDEDPSRLTADPKEVLDQSGLSKKKSLQREIIAENKYVPRPSPTPSANLQTPAPQTAPEAPKTEQQPPEMDQALLDALYGTNPGGEPEPPPEEESHRDEEEEEDEEDEEE
ncbi:MAG: hypothetical protein K6F35_05390 [Lachnospiraceae bacterium]|nr:hypothetical protein [Lachnospiraceae bacterium]